MADERAFEDLWATQFRSVVWTAYLIVGRWDEAMDIAQESFTRAFQHWTRVSQLERPGAWVHRVATNLAISSARQLRRRRLQQEEVVEPPPPPDDELLAALGLLTPAQRSVVVLRYYLDWSIEDVAKALHKRPGTVTALTHQAMVRLRSVLSEEDQDESRT